MNAVFGSLLSVSGTLLLIENLLHERYRLLWLPVLLMVYGMLMLLRHRSDDEVIDLRDHRRPGRGRRRPGHAGARAKPDLCGNCWGSGTVYSAEWNDWRKTGPVLQVRELCPACEGLSRRTPP